MGKVVNLGELGMGFRELAELAEIFVVSSYMKISSTAYCEK